MTSANPSRSGTEPQEPTSTEEQPRLWSFSGGGWVIILAVILCVAAALRAIGPRDPNGFDLTNALVPVDRIEVGFKREGLPSLDQPIALLRPELESKWGKKYLVSSDRVVGVHRNGEARCYPLRMLNWHEVINDTVGGDPIVVTFNGPSDSAVVYSRRVNGKTLVFGHSGLTFNGNLLFYDRNEKNDSLAEATLYYQIIGKAIAGPSVGVDLEPLACELVSYDEWMERFPSSTVVPGLASLMSKCYKKRTYDSYLAGGKVRLDVQPLPEETESRRHFDPVVILEREGDRRVLFVDELVPGTEGGEVSREVFPGETVQFVVRPGPTTTEPRTVSVRLPRNSPTAVRHARYFAWYAAVETPLSANRDGGGNSGAVGTAPGAPASSGQ